MSKIHYPIEQAINDVSEKYRLGFKDAYEMDEAELQEHERKIEAYVRFVQNDRYEQSVPEDRLTGKLIPEMDDPEPVNKYAMKNTSFYVPVRVCGNNGKQRLHECANCGNVINTYGMSADELNDYYTCPRCHCKMLESVDHELMARGLAKGDIETERVTKAMAIMLMDRDTLEICKVASEKAVNTYYAGKGALKFNE